MIINVTEEDIKNGERNNPEKCPIAIAANRDAAYLLDFCNFDGFRVYKNCLKTKRICTNKEHTLVFDGQHIPTFISKFDNGEKVEPFKFEILVNGKEEEKFQGELEGRR